MSSKINEHKFKYSHDTKAFASMEMLKVNTFVAIVYDNSWFIGMIQDTSVENKDVLVKHISPSGPAPSLKWPRHEESCWVPIHHVLCMIEAPSTKASGRMYRIPGHDKFNIKKLFKQLEI